MTKNELYEFIKWAANACKEGGFTGVVVDATICDNGFLVLRGELEGTGVETLTIIKNDKDADAYINFAKEADWQFKYVVDYYKDYISTEG